MSCLALDIGAGTQDALIYIPGEHLENSVKLIYPSPSKIFYSKIKKLNCDLFVAGETMGGGFVTKAFKEHIDKGYNVFLSKSAAQTVKDDPEKVKKIGFNIFENIENPNLELSDLNLDLFENLRCKAEYSDFEKIFVAVQDHGYIKNQSDRITRMEFLKGFLGGNLIKAFFDNNTVIPEGFNRFKSIQKQLSCAGYNDFVITDTGIAAALGALYNIKERPAITIDAGNGHTFGALVYEDFKIASFFEHHTSMLNPQKIKNLLTEMQNARLSFELVYNDGGHGAQTLVDKTFDSVPIIVTGPRSHELFNISSDDVTFATPAGDTMITGPVGLLMQNGII